MSARAAARRIVRGSTSVCTLVFANRTRHCASLVAAALATQSVQAQPTATRDSATATQASGTGPWVFVPGVRYAPETGVVFQPTMLRVWRMRADARPSRNSYSIFGSTKGQFGTFLQRERWTSGNARWSVATLDVSQFPQPFFGVGPDAPQERQEFYTPDQLTAQYAWHARVASRAWLGVAGAVSAVRVRSREAGGLVQLGADTRTLSGSRGYTTVGAGPVLTLDSRDDIYYTGRGLYAQVLTSANVVRDRVRQQPHGFGRVTADLRAFRDLASGRTTRSGLPQRVLAAQLVAEQALGVTPFDQLPTFGGSRLLRGELDGRFRDASAVSAQAEVRQALGARWIGTVFAGAGTVGPRVGSLALREARASAGVGVRWLLVPASRLTVRADLGRTRDGTGVYFGLGESF